GQVIGSLPTPWSVEDASALALLKQGGYGILPVKSGQGPDALALGFGVKHPLASEPFEDLVGLQHEGTLHLGRLAQDVRTTQGIGALQTVPIFLEHDPWRHHGPPGQYVREMAHGPPATPGPSWLVFGIDGHQPSSSFSSFSTCCSCPRSPAMLAFARVTASSSVSASRRMS